MAVDTPARIAVLGSGPIGLEAALYARFLGYDVDIYDRGRVCEHVRRWGHVRMYTPFGENRSLLGLAALQAHDEAYQPPADDAFLLGREWVEQYLLPLSNTDLLADHLRLETQVVAVGKEWLRKEETPGDEERGDWSFRLLLKGPNGQERVELADVVIDATGVVGQPNWLGQGGIPAIGESAARDRIEYLVPDAAGENREKYAGKQTLLVGDDALAALSFAALSAIATEHPETRVTWSSRAELASAGGGPIREVNESGDSSLARLVREANAAYHSPPPWLKVQAGTFVESISSGADGRLIVTILGEQPSEGVFDQIVANVGHRPDLSLARELQLDLGYADERPRGTANDEWEATAGALVHPEANFYVLGAKSWGRSHNFCFADGLRQIRAVFTVLGDRRDLDLYASAKRLLK
jgi:hypothetical protein